MAKMLRHITGWILLITFWAYQDFSDGDWDQQSLLLNVSYYSVVLATFYFCYGFVCKQFTRLGNIKVLIPAVLTGIVFFIALRYVIQEQLFPLLFGFSNYSIKSFSFYISDNLWRGFLPTVAGLIVYLLENKNQTEQKNIELLAEKKQAELAFLRAQLNPHFLFNTLSFLHTRAFTADPELADTILKLSDVLRYSVQSSLDKKRTLEEEIQLLNSYIDIFKKRFGEKCYLNFNIQGDILQQQIEPLLLLPFVENSFKHGIYSNPEKPIEVRLTIKKGQLDFYCQNHIKHQQKDPGTGVGLENIKRRLNLLYPNQHQLYINETEELFTVQLIVDL